MAEQAVRSLLAPWVGGAATTPAPPVVTVCGVRGMLHFWMGGACMPAFTPTTAVTHHGADDEHFDMAHDARKRRDDQEIMAVIRKFLRTVH